MKLSHKVPSDLTDHNYPVNVWDPSKNFFVSGKTTIDEELTIILVLALMKDDLLSDQI